ncbi:MAG TPA: regulatory signaling modulator protein AmpE [Gammaproteobacteria bacterium]|nr:regulatory signaling modulator protein AmpE [Gammaproteobacteria bacterium]
MALISIIIGLFLDRHFRQLHDLRDMAWFEYYTQKILRFTGRLLPPIQFILILALPLSIMLFIQILLNDFLFNLPGFVFGVLVFIYCLGPTCLLTEIEAYIHARTVGDEDEALHYAGSITGESATTSPDQQINDVTRAILYYANERIFATIFWFVILGPFGAISYRLVSQLSKYIESGELAAFAEFVHALMAWIPARMLAAGYALTGNFDGAYHTYRDRAHTFDLSQSNYEVLVSTGLGAMRTLEMKEELASIHAAQALVMRAVIVWIGILAVLTLGGLFH